MKQKAISVSAIFFLLILTPVYICSCKTTGKFSGTSNLTILIVDENGHAVRDCAITLSNFIKEKQGITDASGLCVFSNVSSGEYTLEGRKNGYAKLKPSSFLFTSKSDVFCFELASSDIVFDRIELMYEQQNVQKAIQLLDEICCEKNSSLFAAVCLYKAFGYAQQKNEKAALSELKKMKKADKAFNDIYDSTISKISAIVQQVQKEQEVLNENTNN